MDEAGELETMTEEELMELLQHYPSSRELTVDVVQLCECSRSVFSSVTASLHPVFMVIFFVKLSSMLLSAYLIHTFLVIDNAVISGFVAYLFLVLFAATVPLPSKGFIVLGCSLFAIVSLNLVTVAERFVAVRALYMLMAMKATTLAFEYERTAIPISKAIAYVSNPALLIFGPYVTVEQVAWTEQKRFAFNREAKRLVWFTTFLLVSFCFAALSTCVKPALSTVFAIHPLLEDWATAFSFRCSHYFIGYLSQAIARLLGYSLTVTKPWVIEYPRSLVEVVVAWDYPMHLFLRKYVYTECRKVDGRYALLAAFVVSSIFHGINFQYTAVLISLAAHCYVENGLRNRMASFLSACIRSRECRDCNHVRKNGCNMTIAINAFFSALAFYHLIYLGMPFTDDHAATGYSMAHTLSHWRRHYFASHAITAFFGSLIVLF